MQGGEGAQEAGEVLLERADPLVEAVAQEIDGVERTVVGGPEGHDGPGVLPAAQRLDVVAGDEAAHRVPDQDQLGRGVAALPTPVLQPDRALRRESAGGGPVVAPPVVREGEVVLAFLQVELRQQEFLDRRVAVDLPQAGQGVQVGHQPFGDDSVAEVVHAPVVRPEFEGLQRAAQARQRAQYGLW